MTEPGSPRWTDPATLPPPSIYDPVEDVVPPFAGTAVPPVVLLLVSEVDRRWAASTAIELSSAWAAAGRRIVLADFHVESPVLEDELGGQGEDGVVDIFVYGASLAHSTRLVEGRGFEFIPTGTYTPDADAIFHHPRWLKLVTAFRDSDSTLVLFVPLAAAELAALALWVDQVLLLGTPREPSVLAPLRLAGKEPRGLIVPARGEAAMPPPLPPLPDELASPPAAGEVNDEAEMHLPPPPSRVPNARNRVGVLLLWILLGAALLTAVGYAVASLRPDLVPWASVPAPGPDSAAPAPPATARPRALGEPLPFSVHVIAFQNFAAAHGQLIELREQVPGVLFFISPEEIQGILYFRVLAGALPNGDVARQVRDSLVATGFLDAEEAAGERTLIQETRFSFLLGDAATRGAANAAVDSLMARQVPAYSVAVPYSDGTLRWHLYSGAFPDSASASGLQRQLASAGIEPDLIPRFGSPASPEL